MSERERDPKLYPDQVHGWFGLSYAQFLTIPRLVMQSMPPSWQAEMVALLNELDDRFDWRPKNGRYWVRLRGDDGKFLPFDPGICDYRRGSVEHLRIMCAPGAHQWRSKEINTPDVHEWNTWCDVCGCGHDPREEDGIPI